MARGHEVDIADIAEDIADSESKILVGKNDELEVLFYSYKPH